MVMPQVKPVLKKTVVHNGLAGQFSVVAAVQYPEEEIRLVTFVGSVYGGPVVMVTENGHQEFVSQPGRFGEFGVEWVRRFFGEN